MFASSSLHCSNGSRLAVVGGDGQGVSGRCIPAHPCHRAVQRLSGGADLPPSHHHHQHLPGQEHLQGRLAASACAALRSSAIVLIEVSFLSCAEQSEDRHKMDRRRTLLTVTAELLQPADTTYTGMKALIHRQRHLNACTAIECWLLLSCSDVKEAFVTSCNQARCFACRCSSFLATYVTP